MTADEILDGLLDREGGFVDDRADPGGATIWGLSQDAQAEILGHRPTLAETHAITRAQAAAYYRRTRVEPFAFIADEALRILVVDTSVLEGYPWTVGVLQDLTGQTRDAVLGPKTRAAVAAADADTLRKGLVFRRHLREIRTALADVPTDTVQATRLKDLEGWWTRVWTVGIKPA